MTDQTDTDKNKELLYPELSYKLRGIFFKVANGYGLGLKEKLYHQALIDEFKDCDIAFIHEAQMPIFSHRDGRRIGTYIPDFIIEDSIILEIKSEAFISKQFFSQASSYLRIGPYQLGFIVNFGADHLDIKRLIFTNDRKPGIVKTPS